MMSKDLYLFSLLISLVLERSAPHSFAKARSASSWQLAIQITKVGNDVGKVL